jgi:hypothetical protein
LGLLLFLGGGAGTAYCSWAALHRPRPKDVAFSVLAPLAALLALIGLALLFVPGFLG